MLFILIDGKDRHMFHFLCKKRKQKVVSAFGAIPSVKWYRVLQELPSVTRSGGWIEVVESGMMYPNAGPATKQFQD